MVKIAVAAFSTAAAVYAQKEPIRLTQTIPHQGVKAHFDHFAYDTAHDRPFATLLQQRIVQVVDAKTGKNGVYVPQVGPFFVGVPDHAPAPILVFDVAKP